MKSFLGNFYRDLVTFCWLRCLPPSYSLVQSYKYFWVERFQFEKKKGFFNFSCLEQKDFNVSEIVTFFKKMGQPWPLLFVFVLFKHKFYKRNCRLERDLNSDCWCRRRICWPLDHPHGLKLVVTFSIKSFTHKWVHFAAYKLN